ncbi:hypothetical protein LNKW23_45530 [Paralimibaculum aggregatum]|uniref:Sel1 repeat family protein n=1 Tax=Paralimibaculum aggregatum TaxID=3036245 RepID=A0ABQ6LTE4_9RHOB|nr:hypothetical protein [Limibaculum sp. NKW23]GMG85333.1 hypothetical protein LNKW23_45530 [Limibaculum sp. NKW23]
MRSRAARIAALALAAALGCALGPAAARAELLPAPGAPCAACYALVADLAGNDRTAALRAEALEARGYEVTRLDAPPAHRLHHHLDRLFRIGGAEPGARLVLWLSGAAEPAAGGGAGLALVFPAAPPAPGAPAGQGAGGLDLRYLLRLARESAAAEALIVLDAALPGDAPLPLAAEAGAGAPARVLVTRSPGRATPLGPVFEALTTPPAPVALEAVRVGFDAVARAGWLVAPEEVAAPRRTAPTGPGIGGLGEGARAVPVPPLAALRAPGVESPPPDLAGAGPLCDRLAADPSDPATRGTGVPDDRLDGPAAAQACGAAMLGQPGEPRYAYQYARGLAKLRRTAEALRWLRRAADLGHLPAVYTYGVVMHGNGAGQDPRLGLALIERAAQQMFLPAVYRYADIAERGQGADPARAAAFLRQAARAGDASAALRLADRLAGDPARGEAEEAEALALYRLAMGAGLARAREGAEAMERALAARNTMAAAARCDRLLDFDIMAIEDYLDLPTAESWRPVVQARVERALGRIDRSSLLERCAELVHAPGTEPAVLAKIGYAMWKVGEELSGTEITLRSGENWTDVVSIAAAGGEPTALYLEGLSRMLFAIRYLGAGKTVEAGDRSFRASASFAAAHAAGIAQAGYYYGLLNLNGSFADLPGFRPDPQAALRVLEPLAARAPRARALLCDVYSGAGKYRHLNYLQDPRRASRLGCR